VDVIVGDIERSVSRTVRKGRPEKRSMVLNARCIDKKLQSDGVDLSGAED
jgi:hypothetical protein